MVLLLEERDVVYRTVPTESPVTGTAVQGVPIPPKWEEEGRIGIERRVFLFVFLGGVGVS